MSKALLVEYMPFSPIGSLTESNGAKFGVPGGMVVQGVLQRAGAKNQNGRIYPKHILARECQRYQKEYIDQHRALGELDHPESSVVNLNNVSHNAYSYSVTTTRSSKQHKQHKQQQTLVTLTLENFMCIW